MAKLKDEMMHLLEDGSVHNSTCTGHNPTFLKLDLSEAWRGKSRQEP